MISTINNLRDFFSPKKIHYKILSYIDTKISRATAISFYQLTPILLSPILSGKIFNYLIKIQNPVYLLLEIPLIFLGILSTFHYFADTNKQEIEQVIQDSNKNEKNILIIEATDWTQGSFLQELLFKLFSNPRLCSFRLDIEKLKKKFSFKHFYAHSDIQLNEDLKKLTDKTIDILWIRGHGNSKRIYFNKNFSLNHKSKELMQTIAKKIKDTANITLSPCNTGYGDHNIAKKLSHYCSKAIIHAPENNIGHSTFYNEDLFPFYFDIDGRKVHTCIFQNGHRLRYL